jgi:hypothetical protein
MGDRGAPLVWQGHARLAIIVIEFGKYMLKHKDTG